LEAIKASNITKNYKQGMFKKSLRAIEDLSISVEEGEVFGFLGPNGAGKTTFLKVMLNIIYADSGSAQLLGVDIKNPSARREVGYLPENPYFNDSMNANQLLEYYGGFYNMDSNRLNNDAAKRPLRSYSKGMLQRIGLAQAILSEPKIVFLDEPSTGLDPMGRRKIKDVILNLKAKGVTVFLNSHILGDVQDTCDRVGIVKNGKLLKVADVTDLTVDQQSLQVKIENPTDELIQKVAAKAVACRKIGDHLIEVAIDSPEVTPDIIRLMVELGARIYEVKYQETSLEDIFIKIIEKGGNA
jgi:ABC-2 type transport system ATP-binding protein